MKNDPQDATPRNVQAANKRDDKLKAAVKELKVRLGILERRMKQAEKTIYDFTGH